MNPCFVRHEDGSHNKGNRMLTQRKKIEFFERTLMDFFQKAGRSELPWRKRGRTAYEVWVSEIMLQQTQVSRVIGYYERFLKRFPTIDLLAEANWEEFLPYYAGLGYYARGRNMLQAAQVIVNEYDGKFPRDKKLLEEIPGIGPYTAAAIMSFAYGDRHLAWDTNLRRVIGRYFLGSRQSLIDTTYFETSFSKSRKVLNAALMDFGSALCTARPKCGACPIRSHCRYSREGGRQERVEQQPRTKTQKQNTDWSEAEVVVTLHDRHRLYYSSKRTGYAPFTLPAGYNTRAGIKAYFEKRYGLTLSVRPPHERSRLHGHLRVFVNAQILLGRPTFRVYPPESLNQR